MSVPSGNVYVSVGKILKNNIESDRCGGVKNVFAKYIKNVIRSLHRNKLQPCLKYNCFDWLEMLLNFTYKARYHLKHSMVF